MKTVALKDTTFQLLEMLKEKEHAESFDKVIFELVSEKVNVPGDMFGSLKGKAKSFTDKERHEMWEDKER